MARGNHENGVSLRCLYATVRFPYLQLITKNLRSYLVDSRRPRPEPFLDTQVRRDITQTTLHMLAALVWGSANGDNDGNARLHKS